MSTKRKGVLAVSKEWRRHLRGWKRPFWKSHRRAERREIKKEGRKGQ